MSRSKKLKVVPGDHIRYQSESMYRHEEGIVKEVYDTFLTLTDGRQVSMTWWIEVVKEDG